MKKILSLILAAGMVLSLAACGGSSSSAPAASGDGGSSSAAGSSSEAMNTSSDETVTLTISHIRPAGSQADIDVNAFCEAVTEKSGGSIQFQIYPAGQLGDYTTVVERVGLGDVDMQLGPIGVELDPAIGLSYLPYLVTDWDSAGQVFGSDGEVVRVVTESMAKNDVRVLGTYPLYFGGIGLIKAPASGDFKNITLNDGIKIRVPNMSQFNELADMLGFQATPMNASDVFTSLQTGIIDGVVGYGAEGYYSNYVDLIKYYLPVNDHFEMWYTIISEQTWNKLSEEQQNILASCAKDMETARYENAVADEAKYEGLMADAGIQIIDITDEDVKAWAQKYRSSFWEKYAGDYGDGVLTGICEKYGIEY